MNAKFARWAILVIFLITAGLRIGLSFQSPSLDGDSYLYLRHAENIVETGFPLTIDPLGYGGREIVGSFAFAYTLVPGFWVGEPETTGLILSQIFASLIVFGVYGIISHTTKRKGIAILIGASAGVVPIYMQATLNTIHPVTLAIPLISLMVYMLMRIKERVYASLFIAASIILTLIHPIALLFAVSCGVYILLCRIDGIKTIPGQIEAIIFSSLLIVWTHIIIYRKALITHGLSTFTANTPSTVVNSIYSIQSLTEVLYGIGVIPVVFGVYMIYRSIHIEKESHLYLTFAVILTSGLLIFLNVVPANQGLAIIAIGFLVLFGRYLEYAARFIKATHFESIKRIGFLIMILLFIVFTIIPSLRVVEEKRFDNDVYAWIESHAQKGATIIAPAEYGHRIAYQGHPTIADTSFLLAPDTEGRIQDIERIYTTKFISQALQIAQKYEAKYMLTSPDIRNQMQIEEIAYLDEECFRHAFNGNIQILEIECEVEQRARIS